VPYITLPNEGFAGTPETELPADVRARDFAYVWSLMCCPGGDPAQRDLAYVADEALHLLRRLRPGFPVTAGMAVGLARAPDVAAHVGAGDDDTTAFGGFLSGIILLWIIARGQHDETRRSASLGGAYRMVASACGKAGLRGGGVDHLRQNIWPGYRSVAHLWAAHIVWWDSTKRDHAALDTRAGLSEFLMISEALRREGEAFKPFRAGAPILDPVETWKVRPEVSATWPPLEFRFGDPDAWDLRKRPRL